MIYTETSEYKMADDLMNDAGWTGVQARAFAEYYAEQSNEIDTDIRWDVVAVRCEWGAYASVEEALEEYGDDFVYFDDLRDSTTIIVCSDKSILLKEF